MFFFHLCCLHLSLSYLHMWITHAMLRTHGQKKSAEPRNFLALNLFGGYQFFHIPSLPPFLPPSLCVCVCVCVFRNSLLSLIIIVGESYICAVASLSVTMFHWVFWLTCYLLERLKISCYKSNK